ncbi:tautomerase family protein [Paraburkholderia sp. MMS20-SJTR3]|uniref:Tautomerase family protein n=1 Tax=Paraburkholderia sejongensis TaxID=2886946 RepID=A0ABS8K584_9BURK|nr:tautomerase family protein [Paraburkholderia sp. MMS20-SJTR3]MCC8397334.1 tautomerase family protein [Paraburkholderia sp. MMS20-SJTR3]
MPIVKIEERSPHTAEEKARLVGVVFDALKAILGVSEEELQARYQGFAAEDFFPPLAAGNYVSIEITLFVGRSLDAKRSLYRRIASDVARLRGIDPSEVLVLLREEPFDNWGMHGGKAATDLKFDYAIAI